MALSVLQRPNRLVVPTCVGCGAMGELGSCPGGCSEQKLVLVRAAAHDELVRLRTEAQSCRDAFRPLAEAVLRAKPGQAELEPEYRSRQMQARRALRDHPEPESAAIEGGGPAEPAITWWCDGCGAIDAPQPCLGICVWRPVEWVERSVYEQERERALVALGRERALRRCLQRLSWVTPRPDQWERGWEAIGAAARAALAGGASRP